MAEIPREEARRFIRLVLAAELDGQAEAEDWVIACRLAQEFGMPEIGDDISREGWDFYWPSAARHWG
jgi:hypothetical protein